MGNLGSFITLFISLLFGIGFCFYNPTLGRFQKLALTTTFEWVLGEFDYYNFLLSWLFHYVGLKHTSNLFNFVGTWQFLELAPPIGQHIWGTVSDDEFLNSMAIVEWSISLYFMPAIFFWMLRLIFANVGIVSIITVSILGTWFLLPARKYYWFWKIVLALSEAHMRYQLNFRRLAITTYDATFNPFHSWEISIGRRIWKEQAPLETYKYSDLDAKIPRYVRLLKLRRRWPFSRTSCELHHVILDEAPQFEALSYTWGKTVPSIPLAVQKGFRSKVEQGKESVKKQEKNKNETLKQEELQQILVTSALDEFLYYQSSFFVSKMFWIDAVCINQSNKSEKGNQLPLMTEIYHRSSRVIVWLGPPKNIWETYILRTMLMSLALPKDMLQTFNTSAQQLLEGLLPSKEHMLPANQMALKAFRELFQHSWFQRVWIIQEVTVGRKVHVMYNGVCVNWDTLARVAHAVGSDVIFATRLEYHRYANLTENIPVPEALSSTNEQPVSPRYPEAAALDSIREAFHSETKFTLQTLIFLTRPYQSTDPRDRIFALLGIASDSTKLPYLPNYEESVEETFIKTTAFLLSSDNWFMVLNMTGVGNEKMIPNLPDESHKTLPSWTIDFCCHKLAGIQFTVPKDSIEVPTCQVHFYIGDPRRIRIQAVEFDEVEHIGAKLMVQDQTSTMPNPNASADAFIQQNFQFFVNSGAHIRQWYNNCKELARRHSAASRISEETVDQEFWEFCMSNELDSTDQVKSKHPPSSETARKIFEIFIRPDLHTYSAASFNSSLAAIRTTADDALPLFGLLKTKLSLSLAGKRFCITSSGSMAFLPPLVETGDTIVNVRGGYLLGLLRRKNLEERRAYWVGTALVHKSENIYGSIFLKDWTLDWKDWILE
jgi:Heterokaryon incompatibility protein (HET)